MAKISKKEVVDVDHVDGDEIIWPPIMVPAGHYQELIKPVEQPKRQELTNSKT